MKKTLVALAALAVSGASFAQVTMTGNFEYHFESYDNTATGQSSGMGVDSSELYFNVVEDLGGGMKAEVNMGIGGLDRSGESGFTARTASNQTAAAYGMDGSIKLSNAIGSVTLKTARGADYLSGGISGVAGFGMDGKIFDNRSIRDSIGFSIPVGAGFKIGASFAEPDHINSWATASGTAANATVSCDGGEGSGSAGCTGARKNSYSLDYAAGAIAANLTYATYDNKPTLGKTDYLFDGALSYDFGVAKVGVGAEGKYYVNSGNRQDVLVGVSVPVGAASIGAQWGQRAFKGYTNSVTASGYSVGLTYNLSKRTYAIVDYAKYDTGAANQSKDADVTALSAGGLSSTNQYRFILGHNF